MSHANPIVLNLFYLYRICNELQQYKYLTHTPEPTCILPSSTEGEFKVTCTCTVLMYCGFIMYFYGVKAVYMYMYVCTYMYNITCIMKHVQCTVHTVDVL